jgi:hypothetical protein
MSTLAGLALVAAASAGLIKAHDWLAPGAKVALSLVFVVALVGLVVSALHDWLQMRRLMR